MCKTGKKDGMIEIYGSVVGVRIVMFWQAPYCHVVIVVTSFLHGRTSERISQLLSDLQPLECHVFCSQSEEMHSELIPMPSEEEEEELGAGLGSATASGYSHYGEFQALLKKWTNREVSIGNNMWLFLSNFDRLSILNDNLISSIIFPVGCSSMCEPSTTFSL